MSERAPLTELPLFAPVPELVKAVHDSAETEHGAFLERVRRLVAGHWAPSGRPISMDEVHEIMDRYRITLPAGASPNILGTLLSGWSRARATGQMIRSKRLGSNGNLIRTWILD